MTGYLLSGCGRDRNERKQKSKGNEKKSFGWNVANRFGVRGGVGWLSYWDSESRGYYQ